MTSTIFGTALNVCCKNPKSHAVMHVKEFRRYRLLHSPADWARASALLPTAISDKNTLNFFELEALWMIFSVTGKIATNYAKNLQIAVATNTSDSQSQISLCVNSALSIPSAQQQPT